MNRRDTLKSIIAGLFCGLLPKKATAKPFNYDECEPDYRKWVEDFHSDPGEAQVDSGDITPGTKWVTCVKASPELLWSYVCQVYNAVYYHEGRTVEEPRLAMLIYVTVPNQPTRQLVGAQRIQDGSTLLHLGFRKDEINESTMGEAICHAEAALIDLNKLEMRIG